MNRSVVHIPLNRTTETVPTSRRVALQRKCTCGGTPGPTGECAECRRDRRLQPKLRIGAPGDRCEREADRVAETVMRASTAPSPLAAPLGVQRFEAGSAHAGLAAPASVDAVLASPGRPLDAGARQFMESRMGHDFSGVRVHTDARAAASARDVEARAYTVGRSVAFGAGEYRPATEEGRRLIAHELVHIVQQGSGAGRGVQRATFTDCSEEREKLVRSSVAAAKKKAQNAYDALSKPVLMSTTRSALREAFGGDVAAKDVAAVLKNIAATLDSKAYTCKASCDDKKDERGTCATGVIPGSTINICPKFESPGCGPTALTIIHEAAHNEGKHHGEGGMLDNAYNYETFIKKLESGPPTVDLGEKPEAALPTLDFDF